MLTTMSLDDIERVAKRNLTTWASWNSVVLFSNVSICLKGEEKLELKFESSWMKLD